MKAGSHPTSEKWRPLEKVLQAKVARVILAVVVVYSPTFASSKPPLTLQGKLLWVASTGPVLRSQGKDYALTAKTTSLLHTLEDKRLANREIRVEGAIQPNGTLKVQHFYTVRDGKLHRVRYFCDVCNLEALEPGNCVCCQQPTELQEIPVPESGS